MAAVPPPRARRRARRGSLERPVNGRLYRGTWLFVGLPLLVLAFSVARPTALQPPNLPPDDLAATAPDRRAGTPGAASAARWFRDQLAPYRFVVRSESFTADVPHR